VNIFRELFQCFFAERCYSLRIRRDRRPHRYLTKSTLSWRLGCASMARTASCMEYIVGEGFPPTFSS
jgi:hypothetical protein